MKFSSASIIRSMSGATARPTSSTVSIWPCRDYAQGIDLTIGSPVLGQQDIGGVADLVDSLLGFDTRGVRVRALADGVFEALGVGVRACDHARDSESRRPTVQSHSLLLMDGVEPTPDPLAQGAAADTSGCAIGSRVGCGDRDPGGWGGEGRAAALYHSLPADGSSDFLVACSS
jgi:hypothetical protein